MVKVAHAAIVLPTALATAVAGCELVAGLGGDRTIGDGGGGGQGGGTTTGCEHATYPPPPNIEDGGGSIDFVAALYTMNVGDAPDSGPVGLDLDKTCTCEGEGPSCANPSWPWVDKSMKHCDGPAGRDNATRTIFTLLSAAAAMSFGSARFTERAQHGDWSLLVRVRGYNGQADDDQVEVSIYPTTGFNGTSMTPKWDGNDPWPIPESAVQMNANGKYDLDLPVATDPNAWVTGNTLVASLKAADLLISGQTSRVELTLTAGILMGKIAMGPHGYELDDGIMGARWRIDDVFKAVASFRDDNGKAYCKGDNYYGTAKSIICGAVDIESTLGSPTDPCDAVSIGMEFTTQPAKLGAIVKTPDPILSTCTPANNPAMDSCTLKP